MWRAMLWVAVAASLWSVHSAKGAPRDGWPRCNGIMNTPGITRPMGDIVLLMHDNLTITCLLDPEQAHNLGLDASHLRFFRNVDEVKPNSTHRLVTINETALQLQVIDMQPSESVYYCFVVYPDASKTGVCSNQVVVGTVPQNISDFHCESNSWLNLTCTWRPDVINYVLTNYTLQIKYEGRPGRKHPGDCPLIEYEEGYYRCSWTLHSTPGYRQGVESFKFELTSFNKFGVNTQVMSFNHFANVRPAPPVDLRVQNLTSHMATLAWSIHYSVYNFPKNLVHKVIYCSELDNVAWKEALLHPPLDRRNLTYDLELPYANIRYDVRVFIRTDVLRNDLWSNFSAITFKTNSTIPERPPKVDIGSFDSVVIGSTRKVYLYWQQIERFEENGDNFSYSIIYARTNNEQVLLTPTEVTNSYMIFDQLTLDRIEIHIKSNNSEGLSVNKTVMTIPGSDEILPKPSQFTKIEYERGLYELSWTKVDRPDLVSYTIFWCANNRDIYRCENKVQWETVSKDINVKNISMSDNLPYQFAISANSKISSSGMVWAQCTIVHQKSISKISNVWVNRVGNTSIEIDWKIECSDRIGIIQGYTIEYCPIYSLYNKSCKDEKVTLETTKHLSYTITNLKPLTTYSIQVAIKTANNVGIMSDPISNVTSEGTPTPPINVTVSDIRDSRIFVSWKPPLTSNGYLRYYLINYDSIYGCKDEKVDVADGFNNSKNETIMEKLLTNLTSYTNYTIGVQACTSSCSDASAPIKIRTAIGRPGKVDQLEVTKLTNSSLNVRLTWSPPQHRGGDIDYYEVNITKVIDDNRNESDVFISATNEYDVPSSVCLNEGIKGVYLYVRAVNVDNRSDHGVIAIEGSEFVTINTRPEGDFNSVKYEGPWSSDKYNICIQNTENYFYFLYILFGIIFIPAAIYGARFLWIHFKNMQNIKPCLPAGLGNLEKEPVEKKPLKAQWNRLGIDDKMNRLNSDHFLDRGINTGDFSNGIITDTCNDSENTDSTCVPSLASSNHSESEGNKDGREAHDGQSETVSENSSPRSRNIGSSSSRPDSAASTNLFDQNPHTMNSIGNDTMGPYMTIGEGINFSIQPEPRSENLNANGYVSVGTLTNGNLFNPDKPSTVMDGLPFVSFQPNRPSDKIVPRAPKPQLSSGYVPNGTNHIFTPNNAPSDKTSLNNSLIHIIDPTGSDKDYDFEDESIFDKLPNENNAVSNKPIMINGYVKRNEPDFMSDVDACFQKMFGGGPAQIAPKQNNLTNIVVPPENTAATDDAISPEAYCRFGPNINVPQQFEFHRSDEDSEDILLSSIRNPDEFEYEKHSLLEKTTHSDPSVPSSHYVPINLQNVNKP